MRGETAVMARARLWTLTVLVAVGAGVLESLGFHAAPAAAPPSGAITDSSPSTSWSGGPFAVPGVTLGCAGSVDPTCDYYLLRVRTQRTMFVEVALVSDSPSDDHSLYVYRNGIPVARSLNVGPEELATFTHFGRGLYEVRVQSNLLSAAGTYTAIARIAGPAATDPQIECNEFVPEALSHPAATVLPGERGQVISLDVAVLMDTTVTSGTQEFPSDVATTRAAEVMVDAAGAYAPLNIDLNVVSFTAVDLDGDSTHGMMDQALAHFGGSRPAGSDVVYVITPQDIQSDGDYLVAGQARCIGGVDYDDLALAVGEVTQEDGFGFLGVRFFHQLAAKIAGHEIGHLMSAHHHYGNCVERAQALAELRPDSCTLMSPLADFLDLRFGTLEGLVIRGKALQQAQP
ncbi:MAG: hypothetical protein ACRDJM_06690 [Actinomycetota bacterium]